MENKDKEIVEVKLDNLEKLPKEKIEELLLLYGKSVDMETYVKLPFLAFAILFLIHNLFIAGNRYSYKTYDNIMAVEFTVFGIALIAVIYFAIIAMTKISTIKKKLIIASDKYFIKREEIEKEFNTLAIYYYGGRGVKLKKQL